MSGRVNKLLRKTAMVMNISNGKLKKAHRSKNKFEREKINTDLKKALNVKR